jgi:hypothetical protein
LDSLATQHHSSSVSENDAAKCAEKPSPEKQDLKQDPVIAEIWTVVQPRIVVQCSLTKANKSAIREMLDHGGNVELVKRAIHLGCLRKMAARVNHGDESQIRSLRYFISLVDEVKRESAKLSIGPESGYWQHVETRLIREERRWKSSSAPAYRGADAGRPNAIMERGAA